MFRYQNNARLIKAKLAAYPANFTDDFIKSVEFSEKFGNLREFELESVHLNFIQYYCLDVVCVALTLFIIILYVLSKLLYFISIKLQTLNVYKAKLS